MEAMANGSGIPVVVLEFEYVKEPLIITSFVLAVSLLKIAFHSVKLADFIPESCLLILLGLLIGSLFLLDNHPENHEFLIFHSRTFFLFLLPPIILEAAYSLRDPVFIGNLASILLFAVFGTVLNIALIGGGLYGLKFTGIFDTLNVGLVDCLVFGSLIASVDPVAVLAIFQEVGVNKVIYFLVFGESLFNDAVTIVMYNLMISFTGVAVIGVREVGLGLASFLSVSGGAIAFGLLCGVSTALITKYTAKVQAIEPVVVFGMAYLSYLLAELFHFSGIISIICCGLLQAQYALQNISKESSTTVQYFAKAASAVMEALIFIILGVMLLNNRGFWNSWHTGFGLSSLILCLIARFAVVVFLTWLVNHCLMGIRHIPWKEQFIMAYGGLRGAVSFSLVVMLDSGLVPAKDTLLTATFLIVLFTVFVQGTSIKPLVRWLDIKLLAKRTTMINEVNLSTMENVISGIEDIIGYSRLSPLVHTCSGFCDRVLLHPTKLKSLRMTTGDSLLGSLRSIRKSEEDVRGLSEAESPDSEDDTEAILPTRKSDVRATQQDDLMRLHDALLAPLHRQVFYGCYDRNLTQSSTGPENALARMREERVEAIQSLFGRRLSTEGLRSRVTLPSLAAPDRAPHPGPSQPRRASRVRFEDEEDQ